MLEYGYTSAHWVFGGTWSAYLGQGGAAGWMGYPRSDLLNDNGWNRMNFANGFTCWSGGTTFVRGYEWASCTSGWPGNPPTNTLIQALQQPAVWLMKSDGLKHWVPDGATLACWGGPGAVVLHSPPYVDAIGTGAPLQSGEGCINQKAVVTSPTPGSTLPPPGWDVVFTRDSGQNVLSYSLWVGTAPGSYDIFAGYMSFQSQLVSNIPTNGFTVYVRLWSYFNATGWQYNDYTYATAVVPAPLLGPPNGSTLHGTSATFTRRTVGAASYSLWVGAAPASYQYFAGYMSSPSQLVTTLPANNSYIYVRVWSYFTICGCWQYFDYWYFSAP